MAQSCVEPRHLTYWVWKSFSGALAVGVLEEPNKKPSKHLWCAISRIREKNPWGIVTKFSMSADIQNNDVCNFWWRSAKWFGRGKGSYFPWEIRNSTCNYAVALKPQLEVTQSHLNRQQSIRHLGLPTKFYSNHGSISYRLRERVNGDFSQKSQHFPNPCTLRPRWWGSTWNWVYEWWSKCFKIGLAV